MIKIRDKILLLVLLAQLFFSALAFGQSDITIRFIDEETGNPIRDVMVVGGVKGSDDNGMMTMSAVPGDTLEIQHYNYPEKLFFVGNETNYEVALKRDFSDSAVYVVVEQAAEFPGGMSKFFEYIGSNLVYPKEAVKNKVEGRVFVEFVIGQDGFIEKESVRAIAGRDPQLIAEAVRVVQNSPPWNPGRQQGEAVRVKMVLPINFALTRKKK